jgi:hypothetical protein
MPKSQHKPNRASSVYSQKQTRWRRHLTHLHLAHPCLRTITSSGGLQLSVCGTLEPDCRLRVSFVIRHILHGDWIMSTRFLGLHLFRRRSGLTNRGLRLLRAGIPAITLGNGLAAEGSEISTPSNPRPPPALAKKVGLSTSRMESAQSSRYHLQTPPQHWWRHD